MPKSIFGKVPVPLRIICLFFLLSMIHLYPLFGSFFSKLPYATNGDISLSLTILFSNIQKLSQLQFGQIYHLPFLFPLSYTLTIGFTLFGQSLLLLPVFLLGTPNIYALYNAITIFSYLAAGCCAYLFFKELLDDETVSIISAGLYMLVPFRVYNIPHLNMLFNFPAPLCFYFLLRYAKNNRNRDLIFFNVFLLSQFLFDLSLAFYLSVSLAFFWMIYVLIQRPVRFRGTGRLIFSLLATMAVILLIHAPFLQKEVSLSPSEPRFDPGQYLPSLSFYANKSTLLFLLNKLWDPLPLFPGFSVVFFYFFAFSSYVANLRDRILLAVMAGAYMIPGLVAVVFFRKGAFGQINSLLGICLLVFFGSLAFLVFLVRKKIPWPLKLVSILLLIIVFISFQPFPRIFDLFNAAAKIFPFLSRSRGIRTFYVLPLLIIGLFAFGLKAFLEKNRSRKIYLWVIVLILLVEHFRWPVAMEKLPELNADAKAIYQMVDPYPPHFGILELPFFPPSTNTYSLMTRYHNKHTYHGYYLFYRDPLALNGEKELRVENEMTGLANPELIQKLKDNGIYLLIIHGSLIGRVYEGDPSAMWRKIRQNIQRGQQLGLFKDVKERPTSILIVLDDGQHNQDMTYQIPYFALAGKKVLQFRLQTAEPVQSRTYLNGRLINAESYPIGEHQILLDLQTAPKENQINRLRISNDHPVTVRDLDIK